MRKKDEEIAKSQTKLNLLKQKSAELQLELKGLKSPGSGGNDNPNSGNSAEHNLNLEEVLRARKAELEQEMDNELRRRSAEMEEQKQELERKIEEIERGDERRQKEMEELRRSMR